MKILNQIIFTMFLLSSFISCNKDETDSSETLKKETISAKWSTTGTSEYDSFEFNESGNYIVVKNTTTKSTNNQIVLFGTYEIIDSKTIVLSDLGTIKISNIAEDAISFTIVLNSNPNDEITIQATKQNQIANSTKTKLLCQTWEVVTLGGIDVGPVVVLFSDAGTYFLKTSDWSGYGTWTWCDAEETKIAFTLDYELDCGGIDVIKDIVLTSDSFEGIDLENGAPQKIIMQPATTTKSARLTNKIIGIKIFGFSK